jgi:hypothetical protein
MSLIEIDERGRMTIPKKIGLKKTRAIIISAGSFFITIPISEPPQKQAQKWLPANKSRVELKRGAEELASQDATDRAKRRHQL